MISRTHPGHALKPRRIIPGNPNAVFFFRDDDETPMIPFHKAFFFFGGWYLVTWGVRGIYMPLRALVPGPGVPRLPGFKNCGYPSSSLKERLKRSGHEHVRHRGTVGWGGRGCNPRSGGWLWHVVVGWDMLGWWVAKTQGSRKKTYEQPNKTKNSGGFWSGFSIWVSWFDKIYTSILPGKWFRNGTSWNPKNGAGWKMIFLQGPISPSLHLKMSGRRWLDKLTWRY